MLTEGRVTVQTYRAEGHPHLNPLPSRARRGRGGLGAPQRADTWVCPYDRGVTLTPVSSTGQAPPSPVEGEGVWERRSGRTRGSAPTTGESPSPPYRVRGRLRPLPSRERGYGSRAAGGHVGLPLRPGSHPHPRIEYGAGSALSRRGRGGMGAARRADTWVCPYDRGVTLTPISSTGQAPPSPVEGEGVWEPRGGRTRGSIVPTNCHFSYGKASGGQVESCRFRPDSSRSNTIVLANGPVYACIGAFRGRPLWSNMGKSATKRPISSN